jgi:hypothetical protein
MTESSARLALTITGATATVCYILAMLFGLRGDQTLAIVFFAIAIADSIAAAIFYRQYTRLRSTRWQTEMRDSEQQMSDLLAEQPSEEASKRDT